jgi:hypothetical protein
MLFQALEMALVPILVAFAETASTPLLADLLADRRVGEMLKAPSN